MNTYPDSHGDSDADLPVTERTTVHRYKWLQRTDRASLHAILDDGLVAHVGFSTPSGPAVIPMAYARDGDSLLMHGSTGAGVNRAGGSGIEMAATITILDGLVFATSLYDSTLNYRCVCAFGVAEAVADDAREEAVRLISERLMPDRWSEVRPPTRKELAATKILRLPLDTASVKVRTGPPSGEPEAGIWTGELPLFQQAGLPIPQLGVRIATPPSVSKAQQSFSADRESALSGEYQPSPLESER